MKASETVLRKVLEGQKQFRVPLFQRVYRWEKKDWQTLWTDLAETVAGGDDETHFIGSIVSKTLPGTAEGVSPFLVIDGQQRLTTLSVLLVALRDRIRPIDARAADKLHNVYLINAHEAGLDQYKVLPTQADRAAFLAVVDGGDLDTVSHSAVVQAYRFFYDRLGDDDDEGVPYDAASVKAAVLSRLELVSITLDADDNEYRIFESLNGKGQPLSQADLIRNHFFMQLPAERQEQVYHELWYPVQQSLGDRLAEFFRDVLQAEGKFTRADSTHQGWKNRLAKLDADGLVAQLEAVKQDAERWRRLVDPSQEPDPAIRRRLHRINTWRGRTLYPFLLNVYRAQDAGDASAEDVEAILALCEGFMVRRYFCGVPTNQLNRLFLRLWQQLSDDLPVVEAVRATLSEPGRRWPDDQTFARAVEAFPFYDNGKPAQRQLVLQTLVEDGGHKESVDLDGLTIEHVMPQTLTDAWRATLGADPDDEHRRYVHRLGNVTLTAYNSELSNAPFATKREKLAASNLEMNRAIAGHETWGPPQIAERGRALAARALAIWPGPVSDHPADEGA